jgi:4,5-dihydroxyphthalate decarboxylase
MGLLRLNYGGSDYWDRSHALIDGAVRPRGIDLNYVVVSLRDLFRRMVQHEEFDAAEMSMSTFVALAGRGDRRFVAIPVFPSRNFRHGYLFVNTRAGIQRPEDLRGRKVGVVEYQMTAALWIRAILQHDFGVHPRELKWFTGGMDQPGYVERAPITLPADIDLKIIPEDRHLEEMLEKGDLDALIAPVRPRALVEKRGTVARMFPDHRNVEKDYYRRTGIFPIMHTVVIRRPIYEANRWIVASLYEAFEEVKRLGRARMRVTGPLAAALPWIPADLEEIDEVFGGGDPWVYGIEPNRKVLEALIQYSVEQGLATSRVSLEDLFAPESFIPPAMGVAA